MIQKTETSAPTSGDGGGRKKRQTAETEFLKVAEEEVKERVVEERAIFDVDTDNETRKNLNIRIMLALRKNFFDLYEIRAVGR